MANVESLSFSAFMDDLGGAADTLRNLKTTISSVVARSNLSEFVAISASHSGSDLIIRARSDSESLPTLVMTNYNDFVYALGLLKNTLDSIPSSTLEVFTPRAAS
jgi:hypothetical protein